MPNAYNSLLLDTNIWLDYFLGVRKGSRQAAQLVNEALKKNAALLYAVTTAKDLYYIICSDFKRAAHKRDGVLTESAALAAREVAWSCLNTLTEIATAVGCDNSDVQIARKQRAVHQDFEDNLIIAAAMRGGASMLVTNDDALLKHVPVSLLSCGSCSEAIEWVADL